jgi:hypothetical protein
LAPVGAPMIRAQLLEFVGDALRRRAQAFDRHLHITAGHILPERVVDQSLQGQRRDASATNFNGNFGSSMWPLLLFAGNTKPLASRPMDCVPDNLRNLSCRGLA